MFHKLSLVALAAPLVNALTLNIPQNPVSDGTVTISWTSQPGDPTSFTLELVNEQFHNTFAIANNVFTAQQSITITLPVVPVVGGYTLEAVNVGDINDVFASTGTFAIGANPDSGVPTVAPSTSGSASATAPASKPSNASLTASGSASHASTGFGSTVSNSASGSNSAAASPSAQSSAPSTSASPLINGAVSFAANKAAFAGVLLSALAGAVVVAL